MALSSFSEISIPPNIIYAISLLLAAALGAYLDRRYRRRKLRHAIHAEMNSMRWLEKIDSSDFKDRVKEGEPLSNTHVPTEIYDAETSNVGLLSTHEIQHIVEYYQMAHIAQEQLEEINSPEYQEDQKTRNVFADRTIQGLIKRRTAAIEAIEPHLSISGKSKWWLKKIRGWRNRNADEQTRHNTSN